MSSSSSAASVDQHDYAAIVLLDPPVDLKPLDLSATVFRDKPRQVTILDPEGKPVIGVKTEGLKAFPGTVNLSPVPIVSANALSSAWLTARGF
jgi:hypothetical protein